MAVLARLPRIRDVTTLVSHQRDKIQQPTKSPDYLLGKESRVSEKTAGLFAKVFR